MESHDEEMCKLQVRKVTQDVLLFVWSENGIIEKKPKPELSFVPEITAEFLENLSILVRIESSQNEHAWERFLKKFSKRMRTTAYLFANYFAYASYLLIEKATDAYACFLDVLSLLTHFSLHCWQQKEDERYLNYSVDLFCDFFDKELRTKFEKQGCWKNFNEYLKNNKMPSLDVYRKLVRENKHLKEMFEERINESYAIYGGALKELQVESDDKSVSFADSVLDKVNKASEKAFEEILKDFQKTEDRIGELYRKTAGEASGGLDPDKDQCSSQEVQEETLENHHSKINPNNYREQNTAVVGNKTFKEAVKPLPKADCPDEKWFQETAGEISSKMAREGDQSSLQVKGKASENVPGKTNILMVEDGKKKGKASDLLESQDIDSSNSKDLSIASKESDSNTKLSKEERVKALLRDMLIDLDNISELFKFVCEGLPITHPKSVANNKK